MAKNVKFSVVITHSNPSEVDEVAVVRKLHYFSDVKVKMFPQPAVLEDGRTTAFFDIQVSHSKQSKISPQGLKYWLAGFYNSGIVIPDSGDPVGVTWGIFHKK